MNTTKPLPTKSDAAAALMRRPIVRAKLAFVVASLVSLILSVTLWFNGHENQGIFVGLWVPSILSCGSLLLGGRTETE